MTSTKRPAHMCAAYGCPLLGTMATNGGSSTWWCFAHYRKEPGQLQRITSELNRIKWLLTAISDIRTRDQHQDYDAAYQRICHDFALAQRKDLLWIEPETVEQWLVRLERELVAMLAEPPPQKQDALPLAAA